MDTVGGPWRDESDGCDEQNESYGHTGWDVGTLAGACPVSLPSEKDPGEGPGRDAMGKKRGRFSLAGSLGWLEVVRQ
jgi:hypothetical protein